MKDTKQPDTSANDLGTEFHPQWKEQAIGQGGDAGLAGQSLGSGIKTGSGVEEHGGQDLALSTPDALLRALASHARMEQSLANSATAELEGRTKAVAQVMHAAFGQILDRIERHAAASGLRIPQDMNDMDRRRLAYAANHAGREFERIYISRLIRAISDWQVRLQEARATPAMAGIQEVIDPLLQDLRALDAEVHAVAGTI